MRSLQFQQLGINFFLVWMPSVIERFRFFSTSFQVSKDRLFRFFRKAIGCLQSAVQRWWLQWCSGVLASLAVQTFAAGCHRRCAIGRSFPKQFERRSPGYWRRRRPGVSNKSGEFFWWEVDKNATILMFCVEGKGCHSWMSRGEVYPSA